ncbi:hypothetical protein HK100_002808 [Physocladia obscura]|uniref:Uncharacterized protein n=1 Tax=Physocladia obscura TaxID=109957 RepID=A0AAD5SWF3_9FUNG|nr:hypothetical protein HK100_002808 [Physocladia obscura]
MPSDSVTADSDDDFQIVPPRKRLRKQAENEVFAPAQDALDVISPIVWDAAENDAALNDPFLLNSNPLCTVTSFPVESIPVGTRVTTDTPKFGNCFPIAVSRQLEAHGILVHHIAIRAGFSSQILQNQNEFRAGCLPETPSGFSFRTARNEVYAEDQNIIGTALFLKCEIVVFEETPGLEAGGIKMEQHRDIMKRAAEVQDEDERQRIKLESSVFANNQLVADKKRIDSETFLKCLSDNLRSNDPWLHGRNVFLSGTNGKFKPTRRAGFSFVLKCLVACVDGIEFDPAVPDNLDELSDDNVGSLMRKVLASNIFGKRSGMELLLLSHSGLGMLSLDREDSNN